MNLAAETYFRLAQETEEQMEKEPDQEKKKELRKVAAQNYFYSASEVMEAILKKAGIDLYSINSHQDRLAMIKKHYQQFKDPQNIILKFEIMINYDYRRKIAYTGENGNKFILVKELAQLCQNEIQ